MNHSFWSQLKALRRAQGEPFFVLAPMADVTDAAFRRIVIECGRPDVFITEFVSADGLMSAGRERLMKDLFFMPDEHPIVAQFFGSKPENFKACAQLAHELGFDGVDINMGCPDRKVVKQGAGIGLCKTPELAKEIIAATKEGAGELPVSVKTRLGYTAIDMKWIEALLSTNVAALTVHGRTMKEMSKVPARWDSIGEIAATGKRYGTVVIGNGDVLTRDEGIAKAKQFGVDGIMVGRGIFQNPWFFNPAVNPDTISIEQRLHLLLRHAGLFIKLWDTRKSFDLMKKFFKIYVSGWDGAKELRTQLMSAKNITEIEEIIKPLL